MNGQDTDLINDPREKFVSWKTWSRSEEALTSGGRMGSPQAAHLGASTLEEKQRSGKMHMWCFRKARPSFWETCAWGLHGAPPTGPGLPPALRSSSKPLQPSYKEAHTLGLASVLLRDCSLAVTSTFGPSHSTRIKTVYCLRGAWDRPRHMEWAGGQLRRRLVKLGNAGDTGLADLFCVFLFCFWFFQ